MNIKNLCRAIILIAAVLPSVARAQTFNYEIKGEIKGLKNDTLFLNISVDKNKYSQVKIPANNDRFDYKGSANGNYEVSASLSDREKRNFLFFLDKGTINIKGDVEKMDNATVTGTPINDNYTEALALEAPYIQKLKPISEEAMRLYKAGDTARFKQLEQKLDSMGTERQQFRLNYAKTHPKSMYSAMSVYILQDFLSAEELEDLYNSLQPPAKNSGMLKEIPSKIAAKKTVEIGKTAPAFTATDMNGKPLNLADFKGRYVLIEFWASWCVPCREEGPGLMRAFNRFKDKKFQVIAVSADENDKSWRKAIADDKLEEWVNICDHRAFRNAIAKKYGVQPIPDNFLIDPDGKIIGRRLFGKELEQKLGTLIKAN